MLNRMRNGFVICIRLNGMDISYASAKNGMVLWIRSVLVTLLWEFLNHMTHSDEVWSDLSLVSALI